MLTRFLGACSTVLLLSHCAGSGERVATAEPAPLPIHTDEPATPAAAQPPAPPDPTKPGFHRLGLATGCSPQPHLGALANCTPLSGRALGITDFSREAFDGNLCSTWNSGEFPPQEVSVDLIDAPGVDAILLYPEMTPTSADVIHVLEISDDGTDYRSLAILTGVMTSGEGYALRLPQRIATRFLRVRTTSSPSWVAWRDVMPLVCERPENPPAQKTILAAFIDLGAVPPGACGVPSDLLGSDCQRIGSRATAPADSERAVFDGDLCTSWDSGELAPRAVTGALIQPTLSGLLLVPESVPAGQPIDVTHLVEVSANGTHFRPVAILSGTMIGGHIYAVRWPEPTAAVFVRVRTTASSSRVAWREIAVFACGPGP